MTSPWPRETERLILREAREEDLDGLLRFRNRPETWYWLLSTRLDPSAFHAHWRKSQDDPRDHAALAELDGTPVGIVSLEVRDAMGQDSPAECEGAEAEIGYILDPAYAGRGLATEIARELVAVAFDNLDVRRVTAGCYADNRASRRVLEKVGLRQEQYGVGDSWHAELGWVDGCGYAMLRDEWAVGATS